ncbi:MAG: 30S ribosomal protein S3 [Candidatus Portnoybacteria bacterium CG03_land_8_20_14_0_80_41_10]|uniref:Small ribosomal subunit protein uS3 n=1 Tax=Candidatus Portnoybacteria bacterium CG03_land_8_20_14_0_80_41_10 TaxID=1974808 RepID=A0A2M7BUQ4_9BACT|nr:MAG: 30S ribosomal protein S3 [Candidatus Portnoybacteria bacterium CG03_land_8_20_14_0_80_41_10]
MGQKVHPLSLRIGLGADWQSRWFGKKGKYREFLEQDVRLRIFIMKKLAKAGFSSVKIERSANLINIIIQTSRPGLIIGRGGSGAEELKDEIKKFLRKINPVLDKTEVRLEIEEIKQASARAAVIADDMAAQVEKRFPYRRVMKQVLSKAAQNKEIQGIKVMVKGRLNGAEIARKEWLKKGKIPLQTLRSNIDYAQTTAYTTYGTIGIKVWVYKGEIFG